MTSLSDEVVLGGVRRACVHHQREAVLFAHAVTHMGLVHSSATTRRVRPQFEALESAGLLVQSRAHGRVVWGLTAKGKRRLSRSIPPELPEAPQHRVWREAHEFAAREAEHFHGELREAVSEATDLLDTPVSPGPPSAEWVAVGKRLCRAAHRLASARYCLHEWAEPDDATADVAEVWEHELRRVQRSWEVAA